MTRADPPFEPGFRPFTRQAPRPRQWHTTTPLSTAIAQVLAHKYPTRRGPDAQEERTDLPSPG